MSEAVTPMAPPLLAFSTGGQPPAGFVPEGRELALTGVDPGQIPQTRNELGELVSYTYDLSVTAAASLDIPVVGSVSGGTSRRVVIFEWERYKPVRDAKGVEYHYGYALRFCVTVSKWDATAKLSMPFVAAQAEVGNIQASWMMQVRGLSGAKIAAVILPPQELRVETFVLARQCLQDATKAAEDPETIFVPGTVIGRKDPTSPEERLTTAAVKALAMSDVARGRSLGECQAHAPRDVPTAAETVAEIYLYFNLVDPAQKPDRETRDRARALLHGVEAGI